MIERKKEVLFDQLEYELFEWILQRNADGLKVKYKYILMQMGELRRKKIEELMSKELEDHNFSLKMFQAQKIIHDQTEKASSDAI